ncbi:ROK family transcriptional regulator [soil metagenome]
MTSSAGDLLDLVRTGAAGSRSDLRRLTGLSRTAVSTRVAALADAGLVVLGEERASTGGRPAAGLMLNTDAGVVLAAAVGRSRSQVAVFDLGGRELAASSLDHESGAGPDDVMPRAVARLAELRASVDEAGPVFGVGVSLPGTVDPGRGVSIDSPVMGGWDEVALTPYLAEVADFAAAPIFVGNDADVLARSERMGHALDYSDLLVVKASTGLGLGIIAEGRVVSGHRGAAGEIGHTKVYQAAGMSCRCGDVGCLETVAGGWALVARLAEAGHPVDHVRDLVARALVGDAEAKQLLRESGRRLGDVLAVAINLLNPQAVVIGGDMAAAFDVYAAGVRESIYARSSAQATRDLHVLPSTFGDRAGVVGCAAMALDQVLRASAVDARLRAR